MISEEVLQVRKTLFQDYVNARDRVKNASKKSFIELTPTQAQKVLSLARRQYRQREVQKNVSWFKRFTHNVEKYYGAVCLGNWGSFSDR